MSIQQGGTRTRFLSAVAATGALVFVAGSVVAMWAWNVPFGTDPYATYLDSEPGRTDHALRLAVRGVVVAAIGAILCSSSLIVRRAERSARRSAPFL